MNILKKIGKGIANGTALVVGVTAGFGAGALQMAAEEALIAIIDNIF